MEPYRCKHFLLEELVDPVTFEFYKAKSLWQNFDKRALITIDIMQEEYGVTTINDWKWNGRFIYSGYRPHACFEGSLLSLHRKFAAFDLKFRDISAKEVRQDLEFGSKKWPYPFRVENRTEGWTHIDFANMLSEEIYFFNP